MKIEKLMAMPELERNKEDDGYAYPEKFTNKLFLFQDQYLFIKETTCDALPKKIVDTVIETLIKENMSENELLNKTEILEIYDEKMAAAFGNVNRIMDNWTDKIGSKLDLEDLQSFREEIEKQINAFIAQMENKLEGMTIPILPEIQEMKFDEGILEEIKNRIEMINETYETKYNSLNENINSITQEIYEKMVNVIQEEINKKDIKPNQQLNKVSLGSLVALKESGYSVDDIIKLKEEGLV